MTYIIEDESLGNVANLEVAQQALLNWFAKNKRDLPWRHTRDPYRVLVSEIMLQQTQVDRVLPKYRAFLEAFPTLEALAAAPTSEVIRMWAGLGYNRRAVNMQRTVRAVLDEHGGQFPQDVAVLRALPGIGPYTAGAIACFAFEQDVAFMDTNIRRVIQRWFVGPREQPPSEAELLQIAAEAVPAGQGWAWNQAIMELGALICTAAAPQCWRCPVQAYCRDYAARRQADEQIFGAEQGVEATRAAPRMKRVAERRETPYANSNRFYRGRIVDALRQLPADACLALHELGPRIKPDWTETDLPWLETLAAGLARDGLIVLADGCARLPH
jgi:A/G-specific adenine glycosylase